MSDMTSTPLELADPKILGKIEGIIPKFMIIKYLCYVDHPSDPSCRIYVAYIDKDQDAKSVDVKDNFVLLIE
uniref:Tudor domain-containing protein n=1 Tax=Steinernema glaseri TaxID=37863 RepID=A0A1I7YC20_9BILA